MTPDPRVKDIGEITTRHLFDMVVDLNPRLEIGAGPLAGGPCSAPRAAPSTGRGYTARCCRAAATGRCSVPTAR